MNRFAQIAVGIFLLVGALPLRAQQINPRVPPPPPADSSSGTSSAPVASGASPVPTTRSSEAKPQPIDPTIPPPPPPEDATAEAPAPPAKPIFDPLHAQRSMEVGRFYMNKGAYDAAIDRFIEAANYQPSLAAPWKALGEAYEKKHEYSKAAEAYNKYLEVLPRAPDAAKIKKAVSDLEEKSSQESSKKAER
jgi:tetratricopeptide (TPR) repeat protein